jgi:Protein of unknown function (DUF4238)
MESHTVPRKLLDQFAYDDHVTGSRRLWQYARGRAPWRRASPRTATRVSSHFADPTDSDREARLEDRLNREFEDPVHKFIDQLRYRTFVLSRNHIRQLTPYVTLLWNRSESRRTATKQQVNIAIESCRSLLANDEQISQVAGKWTLDIIGQGQPLQRTVTPDEVRHNVQQMIDAMSTQEHIQTTYVDAMERAMAVVDENIDNGQWKIMHTTPQIPFVIGDAPVVTWERNDNNVLIYGQGFTRPNVDAILPLGPTTCLHILPAVERTRRVAIPTPREVNEAQASFATRYCYTNLENAELNAVLQPHFGRSRIGINAFSVRHRNYANTMFEILMNDGRGFNAPLI